MADYASLFPAAGQQYGVDPNVLSSIAWKETRYNPQAVGSSGEQGMMQFMPATAKGIGLNNPFDPKASVFAGANLLHQNLQATGGDMRSALMMYNAGTNRAKWNPAYANDVLSHAQQLAQQSGTQPPQVGGQPSMPPQMPPVSLASLMNAPMQTNINAAPVQPNLAALSLPQGQIPAKSHSKFTAGNVLGVLGDALMAYGGMQPQFGPFMREQQMMGQQQNFEREKFNQELQMRMYQMLHPEEMMKAMAFQNADQPTRQSMIDYENQMHPNVVSAQQPNGAFSNQIVPRQLVPHVGDVVDGRPYLGGDPSNPNSWGAKR